MEPIVINLSKYMKEISLLFQFHEYTENVFGDGKVLNDLVQAETNKMKSFFLSSGRMYLKEDVSTDEIIKILHHHIPTAISLNVPMNITNGLSLLRRQLFVAAHSIFENFLCHVLRVYLLTFEQLLKGINKQITFKEVVENKGANNNCFDYCIEQEVRAFSYESLEKKKNYFSKTLKMTDKDIWERNGEELWIDIDKLRHQIVHGEELPEISPEYLLKEINYLQGNMIVIASTAQAFHGVPMKWDGLESAVKVSSEVKLK